MSITVKSLGNSIDLSTREQKYFLELVNEAGQTIHVPITSDGAEATVAFVYGQPAPAKIAPRADERVEGSEYDPTTGEEPTEPSEEYAEPPAPDDPEDPNHAAEAAAMERELEEAREESAAALADLKKNGATVFGEEEEESDAPTPMEIPEEETPVAEDEVDPL